MGRSLLIWAGATAIAVLFAWLQLRYGCAYFSRGGSLMILYAAIVGVLAMRAILDYRTELDKLQREQIQIAKLMFVEDHGREEARRRAALEADRRLKAIDASLDQLEEASQRINNIVFVEAPIGVFGTVIWGFGDLILPNAPCAAPSLLEPLFAASASAGLLG